MVLQFTRDSMMAKASNVNVYVKYIRTFQTHLPMETIREDPIISVYMQSILFQFYMWCFLACRFKLITDCINTSNYSYTPHTPIQVLHLSTDY